MRQSGRARAGLLLLAGALCWAKRAAAEVVLVKTDGGFEFFTEGRVGGFFEAVTGPDPPDAGSIRTGIYCTPSATVASISAGFTPRLPMGASGQGDMSASRVRSGFLSNVLAFGLRRKLTDTVVVKGYISLWANIEDENRRAFVPAFPRRARGVCSR